MKWIYYIFTLTILFSCTKNQNKKDFPDSFEINKEYIDKVNKLINSEFSNDNVFAIGYTKSPNTLICKIKKDTIIENALILNLHTDSVAQLKKEELNFINEKFNYNKIKLKMKKYNKNTSYMSGFSDYFLLYFQKSELKSSTTFYGWKVDWSHNDLEQLKKFITVLNRIDGVIDSPNVN